MKYLIVGAVVAVVSVIIYFSPLLSSLAYIL